MKTIRNTMPRDPLPQRHALRNASVLLPALILLSAWSSPAQAPAKADGNLPAKSFEFTSGSVASGDFYTGKISISPYCGGKGGSGMSSSSTIPDGQLKITWYPEERAKLEKLASKGTNYAGMYDHDGYFPFENVSSTRVEFDKGGLQEKKRTGITSLPEEVFPIPEGARKVVSVEIDYPILLSYDEQGNWVKETHTLKWDAHETAASCYLPSPHEKSPTIAADFVNQDSPHNNTFEAANGLRPVLYGGSKSTTSDKLLLTAEPQTEQGITVSRYTWSASGAGAQSYKIPPSAAESNVWLVGSIQPNPGKLTFRCEMELSNGKSITATRDFEVGIRTDDTLVVGWIDATLVPLPTIDPDGHPVGKDVLRKYPEDGKVPYLDKLISALTTAFLGRYPLLGQSTAMQPLLTEGDRTYILDWLFKYAPNPPPPAAFKLLGATDTGLVATPDEVDSFVRDGHHYKLVNRFQVKYRTDGTKFTATPITLEKETAIGVTLDPILGKDFPGQSGPNNGQVLSTSMTVSQINDGSPDAVAVKAFNLLAAPYGQQINAAEWNNIGSMITFGVPYGTQAKIAMQLYPTYNIYASTNTPGQLALVNEFPEAAAPIMNFTRPAYTMDSGKVTDPDDKSLKLLFRRTN